jgi:hypothetical protein
MKYELEFEFEKATKNTIKFEEKPSAGKPPIVGSLYVQKWAAGHAETVKVTLEVPE